ncbi:MAG: PqqD family peptide modification chaperone [Methylocystis sp.]|uniref:PqqD family peptide modification chaperone n=1 Tax=Methylocystis sp. TaxID=1911079 RepID=UPI003DA41EA0
MLASVLHAPLGDGLVLARAGERAVHILNATAADVWRLACDAAPGCGEDWLVRRVQARYGLDESAARREIRALMDGWRRAGLVEPLDEFVPAPLPDDWITGGSTPAPLGAGQIAVELAGVAMGVEIESGEVAAAVRSALEPMIQPRAGGSCRNILRVAGPVDRWTLSVNDEPAMSGVGADEIVVVVLRLLIDLACRAEGRLFLAHGAGLELPDGRGLLLVAPSGSGKTTLATALNAEGYGLLNDDVVPIDLHGRMLGLSAPICLKAGSWSILTSRRPDLRDRPAVMRYGEPVRFLPPAGNRPGRPLAPALLIFPRYQSGSTPRAEPMSPEAALGALIRSESILRDLTQSRLEALTRWIGSIPAHALTFPDLESAIGLVRGLATSEPG